MAIFIPFFILLVVAAFFYYRKNIKIQIIKLKESKQLCSTILENVNAYILLIGNDFIVEQTNYYKLTQTEQSEIPKRVGELLNCTNAIDSGECGTHEACTECPVRNAITQAFQNKQNFKNLEAPMQLYTSDKNDYIYCEVSVSGTYLHIDNKEKILLTIHDITHLKQIQTELVQAQKQAEQSNRLKTTFLANMSHEIRTPLNAIVGFSDLLINANSKEEKETYSQIIRENNETLLQLINDILDLSKIESGNIKFNFSKVNLNLLINELQITYQQKTDQVEIIADLPAYEITLFTDSVRIMQILCNFLNNALKFTPKGSIRIGLQKRDDEVYFYVKDTGIGIPFEKQGEIFNRFVKLNDQKQGFGLGLAICEMIVKKLNGSIGVESEPGKGSTFWFTLPL